MRATIVTSLLPPVQGGPAQQTSALANELVRRGVSVQVVLIGNQQDVLPIEGVQVLRIPLSRRRLPVWNYWKVFFASIKLLRTHRPQLVHTQVFGGPGAIGFVLACWVLKIPSYCKVSSERAVDRKLASGRWNDRRELLRTRGLSDRLQIRLASRVLATTKAFQRLLPVKYRLSRDVVEYFPNFSPIAVQATCLCPDSTSPIQSGSLRAGGSSISETSNPNRDGVPCALANRDSSKLVRHDSLEQCDVWEICSIGRGIQQKNYEMCIRTARILKQRGVRFRWKIVGGFRSPYEDELRQLISSVGVEDCVELFGTMAPADVHQTLQHSHVFALFSHFEWFGIAVAEAMAVGVPVVVTAVPGMSEVARGAGRVVRVDDDAQAANAIIDLMTHPDAYAEAVRLGRQKIRDEYSLQSASEKLHAWIVEEAHRT